MQYSVKNITESVDILELSDEECDAVNNLFYDVVCSKYPILCKNNSVGQVQKCILTDGFTRVEFMIKRKESSSNTTTILDSNTQEDSTTTTIN